jgi:hypothetical protein
MGAFALRTARKYPSLEEFTIRDVADWDHEDQLNDNYRISVLGVYYVLKSGPDRLLRTHELRSLGRRAPNSAPRVKSGE